MRTITMLIFAIAGISITAAAQKNAKPSDLTIHIRDYCDPASFNTALGVRPPAFNAAFTPGCI